MFETTEKTFSFAEYKIDRAKRLLLKDGQPVALNPKTFDLLLTLVENRGEVVHKNELLDKVWANQFVEENNLTVHISALRKIFGEKKGEHRFIVTIPGRGYTFVAKVQQLESAEQEFSVDSKTSVVETDPSKPTTEITNYPIQSQNGENTLQIGSSNGFSEHNSLIGRGKEITDIKNLLRRDESRLVTLTGTGGTGKTRLVQAVVDELSTDFPDGVFFIELNAVSNAELFAPTVAKSLGVKESADQSSFEALKNFLQNRRILLILDNFEQLISAAPFVKELLETSAYLKILVTSRVALRVEGENELVITPLSVPPKESNFSIEQLSAYSAIALFVIRAKTAKPSFVLTAENAGAVAGICHKLDGLPLAIELAAARIKLLSPQSILTRLENSLRLLTGGAKDLPARQQTMRETVKWSYDLLDADEKNLFRRLAVFAGGFSVETAEAVCENYQLRITNYESKVTETQNQKSEIETLDGITSLLEKSLLVEKETSDGEARLRMLEVVREFASECLEKSGEAKVLRQSHARYFLSLAEEADPHLTGERAVEWLEKLEIEIDNFRAALRWSLEEETETAIRMAAALRYLWIYHSHLTEGVGWLEAALEQSAAAPPAVRFKLLYGLAILMRVQGDYAAARKLYERALDEGKKANDQRQIALSSSGLGTILQLQGDFATARKYFADGLAISRALNDEYSIAYALLCLGIVVGIDGKPTEARQLLEESLSILRRIGSKESVSNNLNNLGAVAFDEGDFEAAETYFAEGLALSQEVGNKVNINDAINGFAALAEQRKQPELAAKLAGAAEKVCESIGFNKEPAERQFCETYIAKVRAALDEKTFLAAFAQGRAMDLSEAVAIIKSQRQPETAVNSKIDKANQTAEIVIESHSFSRVLIEEEIDKEVETPIEKTINPRPNLKGREKQRAVAKTSSYVLYSALGAILIIILAVVLFWQNRQTAETKQFSITRLTSNGKVSGATLTPDGKYTVFAKTEDDGESLWLRQIETGSQTQILPVKPVEFVGLTVSPDGNLIYATVFGGNMSDPQIWKMPLLGGAVEEIKDIKTGAAVSLSPDGKRFAFTESRSGLKETHFGVADSNGTNKQILIRAADGKRSFPNFDVSPVAWSPDGGEIACIAEEKISDGTNKTGILLVNPVDGSEKFITEKRWDRIEHLAWIDSENLAFVAFSLNSRQGQIWRVSRKTGEVRQITNDLNSYVWLASADGKLLTVQQNSVSHLTVADFDEKAVRLQPREIFKESGFIQNLSWTPDGAILYDSSQSGKREIWRINSDGSNAIQLTVDGNVTFGLAVSPVNGSLVFCSTNDGKHSLHLADADGKNMRQLTEAEEDVFPNFTADGQTVIFQRGLNNKTLTLWRVGINDRKPVQLTATQASHPAVSPDGTQTAYYFMDRETDNLWRIGLISSDNGSFLGKINLPPNATDRRMRWHPNGKFVGQIFYKGEDINLLLLPTDGGQSQVVAGLGKGDVSWFDWSADGRQIGLSQTTETQDIILISNF